MLALCDAYEAAGKTPSSLNPTRWSSVVNYDAWVTNDFFPSDGRVGEWSLA
jgi:hypothetical protein